MAGDPAGSSLFSGASWLIQSGGAVVAVLLLMSVVALAIVLAKLLQFRAAGLWRRAAAAEALALTRAGRRQEALASAASSPHPAAQALARVLTGQALGLDADAIRAEVGRYGNKALEDLRSWLRPLEVIASLAPLLGLFGTVLGMISAFQALEAAGSQVNPAILSGGIWEALLTTAVGLAVAIPAVAALNGFERLIERTAHAMEDAVAGAFTQDLEPPMAAAEGRGAHGRIVAAVVPDRP
ncbi:MAG: MotA/TolQ/ExbB proton channel family protein [Alphaproteobacteria bacterium]|nr:MotA/TolQ/ExbB proton channel family protein [Alphaproteobacteria bacterium]MCB9930389.1 MotA/TolQ/ExbB proton channel family protein [Alphaproteobacteria bacterium]